MPIRRAPLIALAAAAALAACAGLPGTGPKMSFFVTSVGSGKGGDLGGLDGADAHCQKLAAAVGAGQAPWRAYLSTVKGGGAGTVNARDRIGDGPWHNVKGELVARNVDDLHGAAAGLTKQTALTEKGEVLKGRGDDPNMHDILTGSTPEGRASSDSGDTTCGNWTSSGEGSAIVGHHDRIGLRDDAPSKSWNSSHGSRGCSPAALKATGGDGRFYCFAVR